MFGGGIDNLFSNFVDMAQQVTSVAAHHHFNTPTNNNNGSNNNKPPPASKQAIDSLNMVRVTADDLLEETNKECLICLMEQEVGTLACKLPCGHLFHKACVKEWLVKQCTCPVCRYEIGTDDSNYEHKRKAKMKQRKLRMRKDELKQKTILQLKELSKSLAIDITGCFDKQDIVDKICASGKIMITEGAPPIELSESELMSKNVSELKNMLKSFGISTEGALEKSELRQRLEDSGRIIVIADDVANAAAARKRKSEADQKRSSEEEDDDEDIEVVPPLDDYDIMDIDEDDEIALKSAMKFDSASGDANRSFGSSSNSAKNAYGSSPSSSSFPSTPMSPGVKASTSASSKSDSKASSSSTSMHFDELKSMSISALRELCKRHRIDISNCLEKSEIVERVLNSDSVHIKYDEDGIMDVEEESPGEPEAFTESQLHAMPIFALRVICSLYQIEVDNNHVDKQSLVHQMIASGKLKMVPSATPHRSFNYSSGSKSG